MAKYGIGQPVLRFEDPRLLRGEGRFIHDVNLPNQTYAILVRSPHAHAKLRSVDASAARQIFQAQDQARQRDAEAGRAPTGQHDQQPGPFLRQLQEARDVQVRRLGGLRRGAGR